MATMSIVPQSRTAREPQTRIEPGHFRKVVSKGEHRPVAIGMEISVLLLSISRGSSGMNGERMVVPPVLCTSYR